jgi:hypothetical protein
MAAGALPSFLGNKLLSTARSMMSPESAEELELARRAALMDQERMDRMMPRAAEASRNAGRSETVASVTSKLGTVASFTPGAFVAPVLSALSAAASANAARHRATQNEAYARTKRYAVGASEHLNRHHRVAQSHLASDALSVASSVPILGNLAAPAGLAATREQLLANQDRLQHPSNESWALASQQMANEKAEAAGTFAPLVAPEDPAAPGPHKR